jgi:hypothetical protein
MNNQNSTGAEHIAKARQADPGNSLKISSEWYEITIALAMVSMSAWFFFQARNLRGSFFSSVGPATFPQAISLLLGATSIFLLFYSVKRLFKNKNLPRTCIQRPLAIGLGVLLFCIFPYSMSKFGYYITMAIWLVPFAWIANVRKPLTVASLVIGFVLFSKLVFNMLLGTPL